jgi:hypothetical protein
MTRRRCPIPEFACCKNMTMLGCLLPGDDSAAPVEAIRTDGPAHQVDLPDNAPAQAAQ